MEITVTRDELTQLRDGIQNLRAFATILEAVLDSPITVPERIPPLFKQCDYPWGLRPYSNQSSNTHCYSGCLVSAFASLVSWAMEDDSYNPLVVAEVLNENGAFVGPYLSHPSRAGYDMTWHGRAISGGVYYSPRYKMHETSKVDYTTRPADVQLIANILERHPVVALLDYYPRDGENDIDAHFVLMYKYIPDPAGGLNDDALIMDPMRGYTSILHYFNPDWDNQWMVDNEVSRVARIVCGLRIWEPNVSC